MGKELSFEEQYGNIEFRKWLNSVGSYIHMCRVWGREPNQQGCLEYLRKETKLEIKSSPNAKPEKTVMDYFQDFINEKGKELGGHYNSQRVYNSLHKNMKEFNETYNLTLEKLNDLNFFYDFRDYSYKIGHIDNTVSKNISILKAFLRYLQDNEVAIFKSKMFKFSIPKHRSQVVTLTENEIREIYYCDKYDKFERTIIDVFIFLIMTAMRYCDYEEIENARIEDNILIKVNKKTKTEINVPLNKTALEILERYNNEIPQYTNAYLNRELKAIFRKYDLLKSDYKKTYVKNKKELTKTGKKRDFITVHKSRSTFITLLINQNTPLSEIMPMTGHKLVSTLNTYADKKLNPDATDKIKI
jgi:integrase